MKPLYILTHKNSRPMAFDWKDSIRQLFFAIYPNVCYICLQETPIRDRHICVNCLVDLPYTDHFLYNDNLVTKKFWGRIALEHGAAFINFYKGSQFTDMIHRFKYEGHKRIGVLLGEIAAHRLKKSDWIHKIDTIIPVPLHPLRRAKRGYNQSTEFARGIQNILGISITEGLLLKSSYTTTQTDKGRRERLENVQNTFTVSTKTQYRGRHFLIVDDVITTGATLEACAIKLLEIPDSKVSILCLAVARL